MRQLTQAMSEFIVRELRITQAESDALRRRYWQRYGATLLGLVRHHGVKPAHFLHDTHRLPGLEQRVRGHAHDLAALRRLPGRKYILTNAPVAYAMRVLNVLGIAAGSTASCPSRTCTCSATCGPSRRPHAALDGRAAGCAPARCVLVEDTLVHQKAARSVGMGTVWMQRWIAAGPTVTAHKPARLHRRPAYVDRRIRRLQDLI
jgi:putative hydrolase of the HAD superfamily